MHRSAPDEMLSVKTDLPVERIYDLFYNEADCHTPKADKVTGKIAGISRGGEPADGVILENAFGAVPHLFCKRFFVYELRILTENISPRFILTARVFALAVMGEIPKTEFFIGDQAVIPYFGGLCDPVALILLGAVSPSERQVGGTEFFALYRRRRKELIVHMGERLGIDLSDFGDIQRVIVMLAPFKVLCPCQSVLGHPAEALEHDGTTHTHTVTHTHGHDHYMTDDRHGHRHTKAELEKLPDASH